jgi:hypothetical protein
VSVPPTRERRRKLLRPLIFSFGGLAILFAGAGFVYWQNTRFPARSERLPGTPIVLRIQSGVKPQELRAIRDGLRLEDRYAARALGWRVPGTVEARVARSDGCRPFQASGGSLVGDGGDHFLCVDTASPGWQWLMLKDRMAATSIPAHEYVHVLQAELGCLPDRGDQEQYRWILEGMATDLAWRALVVGGRATRARAMRTIRMDGAFDSNLEPLPKYERDNGREPEYALWHLAIAHLLREAVATRAAPAARPEIALRRFCARVGAGRPWRAAFARSFGLPVGEFYTRFEAARRVLAGRREAR